MNGPKGAVAAAALCLAMIAPAGAQTAAKPRWSEGDTWSYRVTILPAFQRPGTDESAGTVSVGKVLSDRYVVTLGGSYGAAGTGADRTAPYSLDLNRVSRSYEGGPQNETAWYRWPLEPGKSWDFRFQQADGERVSVWEASVKGWESVSVPAGTFHALHIVLVRRSLTGSAGTAREEIWYVPEVKRHVKLQHYAGFKGVTTNHRVEELTAFSVR